MNTQFDRRLPPPPPTLSELNERRRAAWLLKSYVEPEWTVADTLDPGRTVKIDFRYRLADGRLLSDTDRLYATVKEYAWWVRDPRYSRIDDAKTHGTMVRNLMHLAHALTIRNIWSFAHVQPYDIEQLVEECRFGVDAVLRASERLDAYLQELAAADAINPKPFGGLPQYIVPSSHARTTFIHAEQVLTACNLPSSASVWPRVASVMARAATSNGLKSKSSTTFNNLEPPLNVTVQSMQRWLDPLEQLYAMRRRIDAEAITFKPFPLGAARVAAVKGVGTARTPLPPPMLVIYLLEHSARWIFNHDQSSKAPAVDRSDVLRMVTACWILIAAFTARRDEEIDDLTESCLRGDEELGWWLHVYIEKTLKRKEWIPVPGLVAQAVQFLTVISAASRQKTRTDHLFQWLDHDSNTVRFDVGRHLDDFAAAVQVPLHRPRTGPAVAWHWHPHQFRRFFAILYFYRFEGATIEALSHYLKHFSIEMTRRYVTQDPDVAALWTDVEWGYMGYFARSIVAGERSVSGAAGERLKKTAQRILDLFRRNLQIVSLERVGAGLSLIMQRQGMVLTPKPWVTCSCPRTRDAAKTAACQRGRSGGEDKVGPDFAHAGPTVCPLCPHAVTESGRQPFVDAEVNHLEAVACTRSRAGTLFGALEQAHLIELREVRDTRYQGAKPFHQMPPNAELNE